MTFEQWWEENKAQLDGEDLIQARSPKRIRIFAEMCWNAALDAVGHRYSFDLSEREIDCLTSAHLVDPLRVNTLNIS